MAWTKVPRSHINPPYRGFGSNKYGDGRKPPSGGGGGGNRDKGCRLFVLVVLALPTLAAVAGAWAAIELL